MTQNYTFTIYLMVVGALLIVYFLVDNKKNVLDLVTILSGATITLGLLNYITLEQEKAAKAKDAEVKNYIEYVSGVFTKIDSLYLDYPDGLHDLFYEFYGYNTFPLRQQGEYMFKGTLEQSDRSKISAIEYVVINMIIEYLSHLYVANPTVFGDLIVQNKIKMYTQSNKLQKVLSYVKNNLPPDFVRALTEQGLIDPNVLQNEYIPVPYTSEVTSQKY